MGRVGKILACFLFFATLGFGCEIKWENSKETAKKKAHTSKKQIMVYVTSPTCPYCTMMSETTFSDEEVCVAVNEKFIPLIAIAGGSEVPKKAKLEGVPTVLFIDKNEKETKIPVIGLKYKDEFLQELK